MSRKHRTTGSSSGFAANTTRGLAPGKKTRTAALAARMVQRKAAGRGGGKGSGPSSPSSAGSPMPAPVQAKMSAAFGVGFDNVRIHEGDAAPAMGALAFTQGTDIHFAPGQYQPESQAGQELLGHELAHVVQQSEGRVPATPQPSGSNINADPALEREADLQGALAARGERIDGSGTSGAAIAGDGGAVAQRKTIASSSTGVIQRAVGFEFEFGEWTTCHDDEKQTALDKGEEILDGGGYKIEGEDGAGGASAIEAVTKPFATREEAVESVTDAQSKFAAMSAKGAQHHASDHGGREDVLITPEGTAGKFQASPAIPLDQLPAFFATGKGKSYSGFVKGVHRELNEDGVKNKYLDGEAPSPELEGLVLLCVSYIEAGANKSPLFYPKSAYKVMARTSFTKMFSLMPEHEFFSEEQNRDKWVDLVMTVAAALVPNIGKKQDGYEKKGPFGWGGYKRDNKNMLIPKYKDVAIEDSKKDPMLGMALMGMDPLEGDEDGTGYKLKITREEWLSHMADEDLMSKANDERFEGMGAYGNATDLEVTGDVADDADEDLADDHAEQEGERIGEELARQVDNGGPDNDAPNAPDAPAQAPREAPIFEIRGLSDMFGIEQGVNLEQFADRVNEVFDKLDEAIDASFAPQGKPNIPEDVENPDIWDKQ